MTFVSIDRVLSEGEFPGGKVEAAESPEEALAREVVEELGVQVRVGPFLARGTATSGARLIRPPDREEVADRIALHVSRVIERELRMVSAPERVSVSVRVARALLDALREQVPAEKRDDERPVESAELLRAILRRQPDGEAERLRNTERAFWFLGPASYVEHRGEKPMAITWRLEHPLPGDLFAQFAAAVA